MTNSPSSSLVDISNEEINNWVQKTSALQRTIKGIAEGTLDPDKASLKEYGILTPMEKAEEEAKKEALRLKRARRRTKANAEEKRHELENWWDGAILLYGPAAVDVTPTKNKMISVGSSRRNSTVHLSENKVRYSSDYSRWSDDAFQPNDPVTKEEKEDQKRRQEEARNKIFEENNGEFCAQFIKDAEKRKENQEKKNRSAIRSRLNGNTYYGKKKYSDALQCYVDAKKVTPYATNVLMNMALCYSKLLQYDDAQEYCNRVLHIDKRNVKALFHRATIYKKLGENLAALDDLKNALEIDPTSEEVGDFYDLLKQDVADENAEHFVENATSGKGSDALSLTNIDADSPEFCFGIFEFLARLHGDDSYSEKERQLGNACIIVDLLVDKIRLGSISERMNCQFGSSPIFPIGVDNHFTLGSIFMLMLREIPLTRVYVRKSGHLNELSSLASSLSATGSAEEGGMLFDIIATCISSEQRSKVIVFEQGVIQTALKVASSQIGAKTEIAYRVTAAGLIDSFLTDFSSRTSLHSSTLPYITEFIQAASVLLVNLSKLSDTDSSGFLWKGVRHCASILHIIAASKHMRSTAEKSFTIKASDEDKFIPTQHPIGSILTMLATPPGSQLFPSNGIEEAREMLVQTLVVFSTIPTFREYFTRFLKIEKDGPTSKVVASVAGVLLAIAQSPKTDTEACRVLSLIALFNATIVFDSNKSGHIDATYIGVVNAIQECHGITALVALSCGDIRSEGNNSWAVIQRAASLLSRCISCLHGDGSPRFNLCVENRLIVIEAYVKIISQKLWNNFTGKANEVRTSIMETSVSLILVIASGPLNNLPKGYALVNFAKALTESLPSPATNEAGKVTASSVCLPPKALDGSFYEFALSSSTFQGNIIKILIACIDGSDFIDMRILDECIIEKLVCIVANSSRMHNLAVRNAAFALARIVKRNEDAMTRCRELRGIEMLIALGKSGDI
eukprot:CAMPEP_0116015884 /NCGR_PEP_ID=MMETSP0321-20121206/7123_1 /TAXON_ID=163516 /ORGANISM="Leptocylindrus danicus var. danicus, Strain B650" /LENGTH=965 /DNA_ID=CAMNT_0003485781 /DNA_START=320 /DNA_END=3217 /DNA_ORIENTATION=-